MLLEPTDLRVPEDAARLAWVALRLPAAEPRGAVRTVPGPKPKRPGAAGEERRRHLRILPESL